MEILAKIDPAIQILARDMINCPNEMEEMWEISLCLYVCHVSLLKLKPAAVEKKTEMSSGLPKWFGSLP